MAQYTPAYKPSGEEIAVINTSKGTIRVQLAGKDAPIHVGNFVELAQKGFYVNLKFHRYVPGFVIQGGCPNTRDLSPEEVVKRAGNPFSGLGTGGPGYSIKEEYSTNPNNKHNDGALAMAARRTPTRRGRSSTCAWAPSMRSTPVTRCSARPSRAWTLSSSFAWATSSRASRSRTPSNRVGTR